MLLNEDSLPIEIMQTVVDELSKHGIRHMVVGSMAGYAFGEPRHTHDVDIVADIPSQIVSVLASRFAPPDWYFPEESCREAIRNRHQFNILHIASGIKVDVIFPTHSEYDRKQLERARIVKKEGVFEAYFASAEDIIIKKLEYYRIGQSEKHIRDIASIFKVSGDVLDKKYILLWASKLNLLDLWLHILDKVANPDPHNRV